MQSWQPVAPAAVLNVEYNMHESHMVDACAAAYVPAKQIAQTVEPDVLWNAPWSHTVQAEAAETFWKLPGLHATQAVSAAALA